MQVMPKIALDILTVSCIIAYVTGISDYKIISNQYNASVAYKHHILCKNVESQRCIFWKLSQEPNVNYDKIQAYYKLTQFCGISNLIRNNSNGLYNMSKLNSSSNMEEVHCKTLRPIRYKRRKDKSLNIMTLINKRRNRRQTHYPRGRFRGQTQSQYLSISKKNGNDDGKAEAHSDADSSRAVVTGSSGMGQAQSQTMYDPSCEECGHNKEEIGSIGTLPKNQGQVPDSVIQQNVFDQKSKEPIRSKDQGFGNQPGPGPGRTFPGDSNHYRKDYGYPVSGPGGITAQPQAGIISQGSFQNAIPGSKSTPSDNTLTGKSQPPVYDLNQPRQGQTPTSTDQSILPGEQGAHYGPGSTVSGVYEPDHKRLVPGNEQTLSGPDYRIPGQGQFILGQTQPVPGQFQTDSRTYVPGQYIPGQTQPVPAEVPTDSKTYVPGQYIPGQTQPVPAEVPTDSKTYVPGQYIPGQTHPVPGQLPTDSKTYVLGQYIPGQTHPVPGQLPTDSKTYVPGQYIPRQAEPVPGQLPTDSKTYVPGQYIPGQTHPVPGQLPTDSKTHIPGQYIPGQAQPVPGQLPTDSKTYVPGQYIPGQAQPVPGQLPTDSKSYVPGQYIPGKTQPVPGQLPIDTQTFGPGQYIPGQTQTVPGQLPTDSKTYVPSQYIPGQTQPVPGQLPTDSKTYVPGQYIPGQTQPVLGQQPTDSKLYVPGQYIPGQTQPVPGQQPTDSKTYVPGQFIPGQTQPVPGQLPTDSKTYVTGQYIPGQTQPVPGQLLTDSKTYVPNQIIPGYTQSIPGQMPTDSRTYEQGHTQTIPGKIHTGSPVSQHIIPDQTQTLQPYGKHEQGYKIPAQVQSVPGQYGLEHTQTLPGQAPVEFNNNHYIQQGNTAHTFYGPNGELYICCTLYPNTYNSRNNYQAQNSYPGSPNRYPGYENIPQTQTNIGNPYMSQGSGSQKPYSNDQLGYYNPNLVNQYGSDTGKYGYYPNYQVPYPSSVPSGNTNIKPTTYVDTYNPTGRAIYPDINGLKPSMGGNQDSRDGQAKYPSFTNSDTPTTGQELYPQGKGMLNEKIPQYYDQERPSIPGGQTINYNQTPYNRYPSQKSDGQYSYGNAYQEGIPRQEIPISMPQYNNFPGTIKGSNETEHSYGSTAGQNNQASLNQKTNDQRPLNPSETQSPDGGYGNTGQKYIPGRAEEGIPSYYPVTNDAIKPGSQNIPYGNTNNIPGTEGSIFSHNIRKDMPNSSNIGPNKLVSEVNQNANNFNIPGTDIQQPGNQDQSLTTNVDKSPFASDLEETGASASVSQNSNGTVASASSSGGSENEKAQTQVQGTYTGTGYFSAQAQISDNRKSAESHVNGGKQGASGCAFGKGRKNKSQATVQLGSETGSLQTQAQSDGPQHSSISQVQGSLKGGMADSQARGSGSTSSQAQIGFTPYKESNKTQNTNSPFLGSGTATAQSNDRSGQSQSQLQGSFQYGITYNGAAQSSSSIDKDAVFKHRSPFESLNVFENNVKEDRHNNNKATLLNNLDHPHSDHHKPSQEIPGTTRSFSNRDNHEDYEYGSEKEDLPSDYDDLSETTDTNINYYDVETKEFETVKQSDNKNIEVSQKIGNNMQHIILGPLQNHDADIIQRNSKEPNHKAIYQPGEEVPGTNGYIIPNGFRGSVQSVSSKKNTYAVGSKYSPSQAQTVTLTPGNGHIKYNSRTRQAGKNVNPNNLKSLQNNNQKGKDNYLSVTNSVTGSLDNENHLEKQYTHTYYTKSSSCGYFTFTCTTVSGPSGEKKVCKPKIPKNPDGTPMKC